MEGVIPFTDPCLTHPAGKTTTNARPWHGTGVFAPHPHGPSLSMKTICRIGICWLVSSGATGAVGGCGDRAMQNPEAVVHRFITASNTGQRDEVYRLLGPRSQARLHEQRQSAKRVSGRLALQPEDFLAVGRAAPAWEATNVRLLRRSDEQAEVQVSSAAGDRATVTLVKQGGAWRVELP